MIEFDEKGDRKNAEITIFTLKDGKVVPVGVVKAGKASTFEDFMKEMKMAAAPAAAPAARRRRRPAPAPAAPSPGGSAEEVTHRADRKRRPSGAVFFCARASQHPACRITSARDVTIRPRRVSRHRGSRLDIFLQQMINGLTLGSVYAIVALGYTMVYGIIQLINFAHGEVVMIGAMVAYTVIVVLIGANTGLPPRSSSCSPGCWPRFPSAWRVGYTLERVAYRPLRRAPRLAPLITAIGLSIILQHLALIIWSRNPLPYPQIVQTVPYHITDHPRRRDDHQRADRDHRAARSR